MKDSHMKTLAALMVVLAVIYFLPVVLQGNHTINGASREAAYKSAMKIKRYMPSDERIVFDTAFGILDKIKSEEDPHAFAKAVDGLEAEEVINLTRDEVNKKIAMADPEFKAYSSWDEMIMKLTEDHSKKKQAKQPLRTSERTGRPD